MGLMMKIKSKSIPFLKWSYMLLNYFFLLSAF